VTDEVGTQRGEYLYLIQKVEWEDKVYIRTGYYHKRPRSQVRGMGKPLQCDKKTFEDLVRKAIRAGIILVEP
jgi:hypothetical protein